MSTYYIKYITGPHGQTDYPENNGNLVAFAVGQEKPSIRFKKCDGFFLYETGHKAGEKTGAKAIYAQGIISDDQSSFLHLPEFGVGEKWPYAVKVILQTRTDPLNGVSLEKVREITGARTLQRKGGLLKITEEQFDVLSSELKKCLKNKEKWRK